MAKKTRRPWLILDVATAPVAGVEQFVDPIEARRAPSNYKDPQKIAEHKVESFQHDVDKAATDIDLAQITGVAIWNFEHGLKTAITLGDPENERKLLLAVKRRLELLDPEIVTFNGRCFDLPLLMRRAMYLGIDFPTINIDRYRSPHFDLYDILGFHGAVDRVHSLGWYMRRLGQTSLQKPLTGEQEAMILRPECNTNEMWAALALSLEHDARAISVLAAALKIIDADELSGVPVPPPEDPPV